jgi:hypothetical protein
MAQAGRRWQRSIFPWILDWNSVNKDGARLKQSSQDSCVFYCRHTVTTPSGPCEETLLLGLYVDDVFACYSHDDKYSLYHRFTTDLKARWDVEDEGEVSDLLSVEIDGATEGEVTIRQVAYI